MQILRFLRNAFISPARMHEHDRCHFCFLPGTTSTINHVFSCENFYFLLRKSMPAHVSEIIDTWIPRRNNHTFIRLLLAFPKLTKPHKSLVVDIFGNAAHLFNAGNHGPKLSLSDILQTAETFFRWPAYKTTPDSPKHSSHCRLKKPNGNRPGTLKTNNLIATIMVPLDPLGPLLFLLLGTPLTLMRMTDHLNLLGSLVRSK